MSMFFGSPVPTLCPHEGHAKGASFTKADPDAEDFPVVDFEVEGKGDRSRVKSSLETIEPSARLGVGWPDEESSVWLCAIEGREALPFRAPEVLRGDPLPGELPEDRGGVIGGDDLEAGYGVRDKVAPPPLRHSTLSA